MDRPAATRHPGRSASALLEIVSTSDLCQSKMSQVADDESAGQYLPENRDHVVLRVEKQVALYGYVLPEVQGAEEICQSFTVNN